jgi:hypothetical protein
VTAAADAALRAERVADLHRIAEEDRAWSLEVQREARRRARRMREALTLVQRCGVALSSVLMADADRACAHTDVRLVASTAVMALGVSL